MTTASIEWERLQSTITLALSRADCTEVVDDVRDASDLIEAFAVMHSHGVIEEFREHLDASPEARFIRSEMR